MTNKIKSFNRTPDRATLSGRRFNMDYGFVRGEKTFKNENGALITNKEGYNCYFLIVDEFSRHLWMFLFANKLPPINTITSFLNTHGLKTSLRRVRTGQGGRLIKCAKFRSCIASAGYTLKRASFQSGIVERQHRTLAYMMQ